MKRFKRLIMIFAAPNTAVVSPQIWYAIVMTILSVGIFVYTLGKKDQF